MKSDTRKPKASPLGRRLLVIANEAAESEPLLRAVSAHVAGSDTGRVLVVAPAANRTLRRSDVARTAVARRLQGCIALLAQAGIDAEGMIGDADPVQAIEDALRIFAADRLILALLPRERSAAADVAERARARFALPTTQLIVDAA
jgi:hypothetical protein